MLSGPLPRRLPIERLHELHAAVIAHRLATQQTVLLEGLDPAFVATLPDVSNGTPAERLLLTLHRLDAVGPLADGTVPLEVWLRNASSLTGHELFAEATAELRGDGLRPSPPGPPRAAPRPPEDPREAKISTLALQMVLLAAEGKPTGDVRAELLRLKRERRSGADLTRGERLSSGRYQLLEEVGRGGIGVVWKAFDHARDTLVAVKILLLDHGPSMLERFQRGARCMSKLDHAHVVRVVQAAGFEELEGGPRWFFVMDYLTGGNLKAAVLSRKWRPEAALQRVIEAGAGLTHAHARGMVHRDVTPDNILLGENGRARLTDFDLVRTDDTTGGTRSGHVLGKFLYMSPELFDGAQEADARSDVYSLGMTAIFALYGKDLPRRVLSAREPFFAELPGSAALRGVLYRATAEEPGERYGSAAEMCRALERTLSRVRMPAMSVHSAGGARRDVPKSPSPLEERLRSLEKTRERTGDLSVAEARRVVVPERPFFSSESAHALPTPGKGSDDPSLEDLAGVWKNPDNGSTYCMRVINGKLRGPYCYGGDTELTGEYYDFQKVGDSLSGRFRWFDRSAAGFAYLWIETMNKLVGGWWSSQHVPEYLIDKLPRVEGMIPLELVRQKDSTMIPAWAEAFFRTLG